MLRSLLMICGVFCSVVVFAEVMLATLLWARGGLTPQTLRDMRLVLSGQSLEEASDTEQKPAAETPSQEEIRRERLLRVLELDSRENELKLLKRMTSDTANQLISDRRAFDEMKAEFRGQLAQLEARAKSEATEQARSILLATSPADAVQRLMGLKPEEGVELLRGMPEKSIAKILQGFQTDPKTAQRGQELFEALYHGDPAQGLIQQTLDRLNGETPAADGQDG